MSSDQPRPLTEDEQTLLDTFLAHGFLGVQELREQAQHVMAMQACKCGCGTLDFVLDEAVNVPRSTAPNPVPVDAVVTDAEGKEVGGLILFVRHGRLQSLEVYSYAEPLPLPLPEHVTWRA